MDTEKSSEQLHQLAWRQSAVVKALRMKKLITIIIKTEGDYQNDLLIRLACFYSIIQYHLKKIMIILLLEQLWHRSPTTVWSVSSSSCSIIDQSSLSL